MLTFKNVVSPEKQALADIIINRFGSWLEKISSYNNGLYVSLSTDMCNAVYMINSRQDVDSVYNDFQSLVVKSERYYMDTEILKSYLENNFNGDNLTISGMRKVIEFTNKQGIKLIYTYDLISCLSDFRLTEKSIVALDAMGNKVYFSQSRNKRYTFNKDAIQVCKL